MDKHSDKTTLPPEADRLVRIGYRVETGLRELACRVALRAGWTEAILPYPGYGTRGRARVLGRVLLAPPATDPAARREVPGWQRFLTLERPDADVAVELSGSRRTVRSDEGGVVDVVLDVAVPAGQASASLDIGGRHATATVHIAPDDARVGVVCDIDDTVWITGLHNPLRAAWRTMARSSGGRRPVPGMARLLRALREHYPDAPLVYLSNGPWNLAGPVALFMERCGFPAGPLLMTDWGITPRAWFRDGRAHKRSSLERLVEDFPQVSWVLVGDDGEHDPDLYGEFAERHPDRVAAIALRQVQPRHERAGAQDQAGGSALDGLEVARAASEAVVVQAPDGTGLLRGLHDALGIRPVPDDGTQTRKLTLVSNPTGQEIANPAPPSPS
jgi:phosphatidate phosphatase APP1